MKRGQIGLELISAVSIILVVLGILSLIAYNKEQTIDEVARIWEKKNECNRLATTINGVYSSGHGTSVKYTPKEAMFVYSAGTIEVPGKENIEKKEVNTAYYSCNSNERNLIPWLNEFNSELYIGEECSLPEDPTLEALIENIYSYETIFMEDPHLHENYYSKIIPWIQNGGKLIVSEHLGRKESNFCGAEYHPRGKNLGIEAIVLEYREDYNLSGGEKIFFEEWPYIEKAGMNVIAEYDDNTAAIGELICGEGTITYFSDFKAEFIGKEKDFSQGITSFIESSGYGLLITNSVSCHFYGKIQDSFIDQEVELENVNGEVKVK